MSARVSVIIPAYNAALLIRRCIESVLSQVGGFSIEVIIVDDGSTDDTIALVRQLGETRISVICQENQGPAMARNRGLERATGEYVAFLDADDYWMPEFLKHTVTFLESTPMAVAVSGGQIHRIPNKADVIMPRCLSDGSYADGPTVLNDFFAFWAEHNHVCTGAVLMRTEVARQTGGQRREFRICEDLEFWAYLATFGRWGFMPEVLFVSDGGTITRELGWLEKNKRRWASAPTVEEWQRRIVERVAPEDQSGFAAVRARIARNLAYSMILSKRDGMARRAIVYVDGSMNDRMSHFLKRTSRCGCFAWKAACLALRFRESARDKYLRIYSSIAGKGARLGCRVAVQ